MAAVTLAVVAREEEGSVMEVRPVEAGWAVAKLAGAGSGVAVKAEVEEGAVTALVGAETGEEAVEAMALEMAVADSRAHCQ